MGFGGATAAAGGCEAAATGFAAGASAVFAFAAADAISAVFCCAQAGTGAPFFGTGGIPPLDGLGFGGATAAAGGCEAAATGFAAGAISAVFFCAQAGTGAPFFGTGGIPPLDGLGFGGATAAAGGCEAAATGFDADGCGGVRTPAD